MTPRSPPPRGFSLPSTRVPGFLWHGVKLRLLDSRATPTAPRAPRHRCSSEANARNCRAGKQDSAHWDWAPGVNLSEAGQYRRIKFAIGVLTRWHGMGFLYPREELPCSMPPLSHATSPPSSTATTVHPNVGGRRPRAMRWGGRGTGAPRRGGGRAGRKVARPEGPANKVTEKRAGGP